MDNGAALSTLRGQHATQPKPSSFRMLWISVIHSMTSGFFDLPFDRAHAPAWARMPSRSCGWTRSVQRSGSPRWSVEAISGRSFRIEISRMTGLIGSFSEPIVAPIRLTGQPAGWTTDPPRQRRTIAARVVPPAFHPALRRQYALLATLPPQNRPCGEHHERTGHSLAAAPV